MTPDGPSDRVKEEASHPIGARTVRRVPGHQAIIDHLRREISLGRLLPGDRLPAERKLAEQYGVARETLRQALRVLESDGQIAITRGAAGGAVVQPSPIDPQVVREELLERADEFSSLLELRVILESGAAELAALRRNAADLDEMMRAQESLLAADNLYESRRADTEFHLAIAGSTRNEWIEQAVEESRTHMFIPTDVLGFEFIKSTSHRAHELIFEAIRDGDAERAGRAMRAHISNTADEFEWLMSGGGPPHRTE